MSSSLSARLPAASQIYVTCRPQEEQPIVGVIYFLDISSFARSGWQLLLYVMDKLYICF